MFVGEVAYRLAKGAFREEAGVGAGYCYTYPGEDSYFLYEESI